MTENKPNPKNSASEFNFQCSCCNGRIGEKIYDGLTSVYTNQPWGLIKCDTCTNIITYPVPDENLLSDIYTNSYQYSVHLLIYDEKKMRAKKLSEFIKQKCSKSEHTSALEIGCLYGYLLQCLKADYKVKGIELDKEAVKYCNGQSLDVKETSVEDFLSKQNEKFDIVILSHVFEHILKPKDILQGLRKILSKDGKLIISVPNSDSICRKVFRRYWGWWQVPVHINHFNENALRRIANENNFDVVDVKYRGGDSLMILLNFINLFGFKNKNKPPGFFSRVVIKIFSFIFRYWYFIGNEELTIILKNR